MTDDARPGADPPMPDMPTGPADRARGRYVHLRNGEPAAMDERFVLGDVQPGVVRVKSTRVQASPTARIEADVRIIGGVEPTVGAYLRWTGSDPSVPATATGDYSQRAGLVSGRRTVAGRTEQLDPVTGVLLVPMLVFAGTPMGVADAAPISVIRPAIRADRLFEPEPVSLRTRAVGSREVRIDGVGHEGVVHEVTSGSDPGAEYVVDAGGLVLSSSWRDPGGVLWEAQLTEVTGPWPAPGTW